MRVLLKNTLLLISQKLAWTIKWQVNHQNELLIDQCKNVQQAMGTTKRVVSASEIEQRKNMRRSVIVTKDLSAGTQLQAEDLDVKRPGTGISPEHINNLIGKS